MQIRMQLATLKKQGMTASEYFDRVKGYADTLAASGSPLQDDEIISYLLSGLNEDYDSLVTSITIRPSPMTLSEVYNHLISFEMRRASRSSTTQLDASSVNYASRGGPGNRGGRGGNGGGRAPRGRNGGGGGGGNGRNNGGTRSSSSSSTTKPECQIYGKEGHLAKRCWYRYDEDDKKTTAYASNPSYSMDSYWISDTGATDHVTNYLDRLAVREKYQGKDQIQIAGGTGMPILHVGHSQIFAPHRSLKLKNILHAPASSKHLLSVHRFTSDNNVFFEFHPHFFVVKDRVTKIPLLHGRCKNGLYPLALNSGVKSSEALHVATPTAETWHYRLGHPGLSVVQRVVSQNNLLVSSNNVASVCNACQMAKSHQLPFSDSNKVTASPLEIVHTDVWGPAVRSSSGFHYYVSFIDDSKFTWIYLIKHKSEVENIFLQFHKHVERMMNKKILSVQSDWGGEYQRLHQYFQDVGIQHRISCPHTHQQNGVAERKHRHIVDVGLALLAHSSMPLRFWDEAFLTACYLINRIPSRVIQHLSPFEKFTGSKPDYSSLKIFGSASWPNLRPYNAHKLSFRSQRCVFLGYSSHHKGYKCLLPSTGRVYLSRDVIFDEHCFPYAESSINTTKPIVSETALLPPVALPSEPSQSPSSDSAPIASDHMDDRVNTVPLHNETDHSPGDISLAMQVTDDIDAGDIEDAAAQLTTDTIAPDVVVSENIQPEPAAPPAVSRPCTRLQNQIIKPKKIQ